MKILEKLKNLFTKSKRKKIGEDFEIEEAPWTGLPFAKKMRDRYLLGHCCFSFPPLNSHYFINQYYVWFKGKRIPGRYYLWEKKILVDEEAIQVTEEYVSLLLSGKLFRVIKKILPEDFVIEIPENRLKGNKLGEGIKESVDCISVWKGKEKLGWGKYRYNLRWNRLEKRPQNSAISH